MLGLSDKREMFGNIDLVFLSDLLENCEFDKAAYCISNLKRSEQNDVLFSLSEKKGIIVYKFLEILIRNSNDPFYYELLINIFHGSLCYINGAYKIIEWYLKELIALYPDSIEYKEWMLELALIPDVKVTNNRIRKLANDIILLNPNHRLANKCLNNLAVLKEITHSDSDVKKNINDLEFEKARIIFDLMDEQKKRECIFEFADENKSIIIYRFVEYLIENNESIFLNELACVLLKDVFNEIIGAKQLLIYHMTRIRKLEELADASANSFENGEDE